MTTTGTLHAHPTDDAVVLLKVPVDLNDDMGRFAPARFDLGMRAYLVLTEHVDALRRFARSIGLHIVDQRQAPPGERTLMPECGNSECRQPAKLTAQPIRCPACGRPWVPSFDYATEAEHAKGRVCVRCGHEQLRSFGYCARCGEVMPPDDTPRRHIDLGREHLDDPKPLGECITETTDWLLPEEDA